jgi:hypothetical protein
VKQHRGCALAFLLGAALQACHTPRQVPMQNLAIDLQSSTPMMLVARGDSGAAIAPCAAIRATATVSQLRGDTLYFARIAAWEDPQRRVRCAFAGPGYLVEAANPNLRVAVMRRDQRATVLAAIMVALGLFGSLAVLAMRFGGGDT